MKTIAFFCLFISFVAVSKGQGEFIGINNSAADIPFSQTNSTSSIAKFIDANYKTETDKIRAIYFWVTSNIKYDTDSAYAINSGNDPQARVIAALRRRKGVCENYAALFTDIALKCGIQCYEIAGYTKQYGSIDKTAHMWCAVYLETQWYFCDPTWDTGLGNNARYFLVSPSLFIESHMPFDPIWQLLDHTVSHKEFYNGNTSSRKDKPKIDFTDSMNRYIRLNELEKLEAGEKRMRQTGIANEHIRTNLAYTQMQISIFYEEKNRNIYNAAVLDFNDANDILNNFILYRNSRFIPLKTDHEINNILSPIDSIIFTANKKLDVLDNSPENFQYDTEALRNRLKTLSTSLQDQKDFLKKYLSTALLKRDQLFINKQ